MIVKPTLASTATKLADLISDSSTKKIKVSKAQLTKLGREVALLDNHFQEYHHAVSALDSPSLNSQKVTAALQSQCKKLCWQLEGLIKCLSGERELGQLPKSLGTYEPVEFVVKASDFKYLRARIKCMKMQVVLAMTFQNVSSKIPKYVTGSTITV